MPGVEAKGDVQRARRRPGVSGLPQQARQLRVQPRRGFRVGGRRPPGRHPDRLQRPFQIPAQPPDVRHAGIALRIRFQVHHRLVGSSGLLHTTQVHQNVPEQSVIEGETAPGHERAGDRLRLGEPMPALQRVAAEQEGGGRARLPLLQGEGALLGQQIKPRITRRPSLPDIEPAQPLQRPWCRVAGPHPLLATTDLLVHPVGPHVGGQGDGQRIPGCAHRLDRGGRAGRFVPASAAGEECGERAGQNKRVDPERGRGEKCVHDLHRFTSSLTAGPGNWMHAGGIFFRVETRTLPKVSARARGANRPLS